MSKPLPESVPVSAPVSRQKRKPSPATTQAALVIAQQLADQQATDIAVLDMSGPLVIADYFVIATVTNTRQAQAIARDLDAAAKAASGRKRRNTGGMESEDSNWVLLDFDDVVVHLFLPEARAYYGLESLWADVPRVPFTPVARPAQPAELPDVGGFQFRVFPAPDQTPTPDRPPQS